MPDSLQPNTLVQQPRNRLVRVVGAGRSVQLPNGLPALSTGQSTLLTDDEFNDIPPAAFTSGVLLDLGTQGVTVAYSGDLRRHSIPVILAPIVGTPIVATVTNEALTTNVATLTTAAAHGFTVGQSVVVALSPVDAVFDGTYTIVAVPTATTFTYDRTNNNVNSVATGGTATSPNVTQDVVSFTPGYAGTIRRIAAVVSVPATTASKLATLGLRIGATPVTGGAVSLTSAAVTPQGAVVAGTAVTAANVITSSGVLTIAASALASGTTFLEGVVIVEILIDPT